MTTLILSLYTKESGSTALSCLLMGIDEGSGETPPDKNQVRDMTQIGG